jgi:hypothetical protein
MSAKSEPARALAGFQTLRLKLELRSGPPRGVRRKRRHSAKPRPQRLGRLSSRKPSGPRYFQIELPLDSSQQSYAPAIAEIDVKTTRHGGREIDTHRHRKRGLSLLTAGLVFKKTVQVSRDKFLSTGQRVSTSGETWRVYLSRATDTSPRSDPVWLQRDEPRRVMNALDC